MSSVERQRASPAGRQKRTDTTDYARGRGASQVTKFDLNNRWGGRRSRTLLPSILRTCQRLKHRQSGGCDADGARRGARAGRTETTCHRHLRSAGAPVLDSKCGRVNATSAQSCLLWTVDVLKSMTGWREVGAPVKLNFCVNPLYEGYGWFPEIQWRRKVARSQSSCCVVLQMYRTCRVSNRACTVKTKF